MLSFATGMTQDQDPEAGQSGITGTPREIVNLDGITIPVYDFEGLKPMFALKDDTTYVINFWATWCKPCVEELPYFQRISNEMKGNKVKFLYVSLDFRKNLETALIPFIKSKGFPDNVVMLSDPDANSWIDQVDPSWSGAIPATLIYRNDRRAFFEMSLSYEDLNSNIQSFISNQHENN
jgi:thiol-disulfide isomerase/thioredoxin